MLFMRIIILLLSNVFTTLSFAQIKNENQNIINSNNAPIAGIYRVELRECYNNKGELFYSTFFEGIITINENGNYITANKNETNNLYFRITKTGSTYKISDNSEISKQEGSFAIDLFKSSEIKLKLLSTDKDHMGWYSIYTLRRIIDKKDIYKNTSQGTGFFITTSGYILTNYHVIANSKLTNVFINDEEYNCEIIFTNEIDDIAVIRVKDTAIRFSAMSFSSKNLEVGDDVIALGFPLASTMGKELKMSSGIINSIKGFQDDVRYFQFSAPIDPGNSGGPVLDKSGNLVGLITAKYTSATNAGYALNLINIIKNIPSAIGFKNDLTPQIISNSDIYSKHKNSIVLIKAYSL